MNKSIFRSRNLSIVSIFFATVQVHSLTISQVNQKDSPILQALPITIHTIECSRISPLVFASVICIFCSIKESKSLEMVSDSTKCSMSTFICPVIIRIQYPEHLKQYLFLYIIL